MSKATLLSTAMESTALSLCDTPGVTAVTLRSGRRVKSFGTPVGEPRTAWSLGSNVHVEVWGDDSPAVDAMIELARVVDLREQEISDLAEALTKANDRQLRLFEVGRLTVDSLNRERTASRVLSHAVALTESDRGLLLRRNEHNEWIVEATTQDHVAAAEDWLFVAAQNALGRVGSQRVISTESGNHGLLARAAGDQDSYLLVGRTGTSAYGTAERKILDSVATSLSSSLRLIDLHEAALETVVVENDHAMATSLAAAVLQSSLPKARGIELAAITLPARNVGGDFYCAVATNGSVRFVVGDVAGKGLPAAVLMTNAITAANYVFTHTADSEATSVDLLDQISDALETLLIATNRFITMVVGIAVPDPIKPGVLHVSLANAGHSPVILQQDGIAHVVPPITPPVGVGRRPTGSGYSAVLAGDDRLFVGSDGLVEQGNDDGEHFGHHRLEAMLPTPCAAAELMKRVMCAVSDHGNGTARADDQTVFVLGPVQVSALTEERSA